MKYFSDEQATELIKLLLQNDKNISDSIPEWAKSKDKPKYDAGAVGALSADTHIPQKISELENDKEYQTKTEIEKTISKIVNSGTTGGIVSSDNKYPIGLEVTKEKTKINQAEKLDLNDLIVKCNYDDGTSGYVEHYNTNVNEIDTRFPGTKILRITYSHNGVSVEKTLPITITFSESADNKQYAFKLAKDGVLESGKTIIKLANKIIKYSKLRIRLKAEIIIEQNLNDGYTTIGFGNYSIWGSNTVGDTCMLNPYQTGVFDIDIDIEKTWDRANIDTAKGNDFLTIYCNGGNKVQGSFYLKDCSIAIIEEVPKAPSALSVNLNQTRFIIGEDFSVAELSAIVTYNNETKANVSSNITTDIKEVMDNIKVGNNEITVSYTENGYTTTTILTLTAYERDLTEPQEFHDMTAREYCEAWGYGVNYGNVLDARPNGYGASTTRTTIDSYIKDHQNPEGGDTFMNQETAWGQPICLAEHFKAFKEAGFNMVRIPVSWCYNSYIERNKDGSPVVDSDGYTIRHIGKFWACRVRQVVDWALDAGLYVVINMHHEQPIIYAASTATQMEQAYRDAKNMWKEIADKFKYYNEKLSFEGFNEIDNLKSSFNYSDESAEQMNKFNQIFVDTVRASGGNNTKRVLHCPTIVHIATENALSAWKLPNDTIEDHIILNVHDYSLAYLQHLDTEFLTMEKYSDLYNVPVCIGEWGTTTGECDGSKDDLGNRDIHAQNFAALAKLHKLYPIWWDNNSNYRLFLKNNTSQVEIDKYINTELCTELQNRIKTGYSDMKGFRIPDNQIAIYNQLDQFELLNWDAEKGYFDSYWGTATLKTPISTEGMLNKTLTVSVTCSGLATDLWVQLATVRFLREYNDEETGETKYELLNSEGGGYHNRTVTVTFENPKCTHILISLNAAQTNIKTEQWKQMLNNGDIRLQYMCFTKTDIFEHQYKYRTLSFISGVKEKTIYSVGDTLNIDDITMTATYDDGYTKNIIATFDTSNINMSEKGIYNIKASYTDGNITKTCDIEIMVGQVLQLITATKTTTQSKVGIAIDTSDIEITATYTDGSSAIVTGWTSNVSDIDVNKPNNNIDIIITYTDIALNITRKTTIKYIIYDKITLLESSDMNIEIGSEVSEKIRSDAKVLSISGLQNYMYGFLSVPSSVKYIYANAINNSTDDMILFVPNENIVLTLTSNSNKTSGSTTLYLDSTKDSDAKNSTNATITLSHITDSKNRIWSKILISKKASIIQNIDKSMVNIYLGVEADLDDITL